MLSELKQLFCPWSLMLQSIVSRKSIVLSGYSRLLIQTCLRASARENMDASCKLMFVCQVSELPKHQLRTDINRQQLTEQIRALRKRREEKRRVTSTNINWPEMETTDLLQHVSQHKQHSKHLTKRSFCSLWAPPCCCDVRCVYEFQTWKTDPSHFSVSEVVFVFRVQIAA